MSRRQWLLFVSVAALAACAPENTGPAANTAPTASALSVSTAEDTALAGSLAGTDAEGSALTYALVSPPSHGTATLSSSGSYRYTPATNYAGSDSLSFKVSDGELESATAVVSITVTPVNDPPSITLVSLGAGPFHTNDTLTATPSGYSDVEGDPEGERFQWFVNDAALPGATSATLSGSSFSRGDRVRCQVKPFDGTDTGAAVDSIEVTIADSPPSFTAVSLGAGPDFTNDTLTCAASGFSDLDADPEGYEYQWTRNGTALFGATSSTLDGTLLFDKGDTLTCTATAFDGTLRGNSATSAPVTILNSLPVVVSASLAGGPFFTDSTATCAVSGASDADGDTLSFVYEWRVNAVPVAGQTGSTLAGTFFTRGNALQCFVTPHDGTTSGSQVTSDVALVANAPPAIASVSLGSGPYDTNAVISCTASGLSDRDGDTISLSYAWLKNGTAIAGQTGTSLDGSTAFDTGDQIVCVATPTDSIDSGSPVSSNTVTIVGGPPSFTTASIGAGPYTTNSVITATGSGFSDPDSDPEGYRYQWLRNGTPLAGQTTATLDGASSFSKGDTVACEITAFDGQLAGNTLTSNTVTIQDSAPALTSASLGAGPFATNDTLTCTASGASDPDGDTVSFQYAWQVNGTPVSGQTASTLSGSQFGKGDGVQCVATPSDGTLSGTPVTSSTATIVNSAPSVTSASVGAGPYGTNSVIPCTPGGASDPDGDTLTFSYAWIKNGSAIAGQTGATLDGASWFGIGDQIACQLTASDGSLSSAQVTSSAITITNAPPSFTTAAIGAGPFFTNDVITATASGFSDSDGDPEGYKYQWVRNGGPIAGQTSSTLDGASWFSHGDTIRCDITAFDGSADGNTLSTSTVTIQNTPPAGGAASLGAGPYNTQSTLFCAQSGFTDADGDFVSPSYAWYRNGTLIAGQTSSTLDGFTQFDKADTLRCEITGSDASASTAPVSSSTITIIDSPLVAQPGAVGTFPNVAVTGTLLATDLDGDPVVSYAIGTNSANGTATITNASTGAFTFTPTAAFVGTTSFTFTANDGTSNTPPATVTVTVYRGDHLAYGDLSSCAIAADRSLRCWGSNVSGQLGNDTQVDSNAPVREALALTDWMSVAVGGGGSQTGYGIPGAKFAQACAIRLDGSLWCWGRNFEGQLGSGAAGADVLRPTLVDSGKWVEVTAGAFHSCGIKKDATLWCWGTDHEGQLGGGGIGFGLRASPGQVGSSADWVHVSAGDEHTCAINTAGALYCFGEGNSGALGGGDTTSRGTPRRESTNSIWKRVSADAQKTCGVRTDGQLMCWGAIKYPIVTSPQFKGGAANWVEVATGFQSACALNSAGGISCWSMTGPSSPGPIDAATDWGNELSSGPNGTCARKTNGTTWCWGTNMLGETATGTDQSNLVPQQVGAATNWRQASARKTNFWLGGKQDTGYGVAATRTDGTLWSSGSASPGDGTSFGTGVFTQPTPLVTTWAATAANHSDTCATRTDGTLWCWGSSSTTPVQIGTDTDWAQGSADLVAGDNFQCARKTGGTLWCWGINSYGQLGQGDTVTRSAPTAIAGASWLSAAVGSAHTCGIKTDGTLWCWGSNRHGQLGTTPGPNSTLPQNCGGTPVGVGCSLSLFQVGTATDWVKVVAGDEHTCALNSGGTLSCWGESNAGQVGSGTTGTMSCNNTGTPPCSPTPTVVGTGYADVFAGFAHSCGRKTTGELWCWGLNDSGQVGDGTLTNRLAPVQLLSGATGWLDVALGDNVSCAVRDGGSGLRPLWCWGRSNQGAFGDGNAFKAVPVQTLLP